MKYKVNELAKILGVSTNTIRRFEDEGYIVPERDASSYRWYSDYDLNKGMIARMSLKCGFSHDQIMKMFNSEFEDNIGMCEKQLEDMDKEIQRLTYMRHWLKDTLQLMRTSKSLGEEFMIFDNLDMVYVTFNENGKITHNKEKMELINYFLYDIPEIRFAQIYRAADIIEGKYKKNSGLVLKVKDMERFNIDSKLLDNPYLERYPKKKCLLGTITVKEVEVAEGSSESKLVDYHMKMKSYMIENEIKPDGDVLCILMDVSSGGMTYLVSVPILEN